MAAKSAKKKDAAGAATTAAAGEKAVGRDVVAQPSKRSVVREYAEALGMAVVLALLIRTFVVQAFKIPSGSMLPTLKVGDHLLVNKFVYGVRIPGWGVRVFDFFHPEHDDVIVFIYPQDRSKDFIKRVKAVEGDTIEIRDKTVYVNGEPVEDENAHFASGSHSYSSGVRDNFGPYTVPEEHVFVMGDNRDHSHDSRFWGSVPIDDVLGKAFVLYWSWDSERFRPRWTRIGNSIP